MTSWGPSKMPYITEDRREALVPSAQVGSATAGELNFVVTSVVMRFVIDQGLSYQTINDVEGALQNASKEFARRVTAPYEDLKIQENGDVYGPVLALLSAAKRQTPQGAPDARPTTQDQDDDDFNYGGGCCPCQGCGDGEG